MQIGGGELGRDNRLWWYLHLPTDLLRDAGELYESTKDSGTTCRGGSLYGNG